MGSIRNSDTMGSLFMDFRFQGQRCREYTALTDTPINRKKLAKVLAKIESEINAGTFVYANYFPNSKALKRFARANLEKAAPTAVMEAISESAEKTAVEPKSTGPLFCEFSA